MIKNLFINSPFLLLFLVLISESARAVPKTHTQLNAGDLRKNFKVQKLDFVEPQTQKTFHVEAVSMVEVLDAKLGKGWSKNYSALSFECADGYKALVRKDRIEKYKALLALGTSDGSTFGFEKGSQKKHVNFGPLYLVWDHSMNASQLMSDQGSWPYQIVAIQVVK